MKEFFVTYWKELAEAIILVLIFIIGLIGTKKGKNSPVMECVYAQLPLLISHYEEVYGSGHGETKKAAVMESAGKLFYKLTGLELKNSEFFYQLIDKQIEKILSTPSRKEKNEK